MKLEFDLKADAAYFEIASNEVAVTKEIEPGIMADYDINDHLVGIEVLFISKRATMIPQSKVEYSSGSSGLVFF